MRHLLLGISVLLAAGAGCAAGRDAGEACAVTADCRPELICVLETCNEPGAAVCGDGQCDVGETATTCCTDCICPAGQGCDATTKSCKPSGATSKMTWNITNNCLTGGFVQYRFFDRITKAALSNVATLNPAASVAASVTCQTGRGVCFGGRDTRDSSFYGMDVDGAQNCVGCCMICAQKSVTFGPLTCS